MICTYSREEQIFGCLFIHRAPGHWVRSWIWISWRAFHMTKMGAGLCMGMVIVVVVDLCVSVGVSGIHVILINIYYSINLPLGRPVALVAETASHFRMQHGTLALVCRQ